VRALPASGTRLGIGSLASYHAAQAALLNNPEYS